jgi:2-dehydro-3-deoxygluconokinase
VPAGPELITLGECLVALVAQQQGPLADAVTFRAFAAGSEANVAVGVARLEHPVAFVGRVGRDGFGSAILRRLRGEGVDVSAVAVEESAPTALLVRERRAIGPSEVLYYRSGSAGSRLSPEDLDRALELGLLAGARWLHITGITPALSASARAAVERALELARAGGLTVSLDLNLRRKLWRDDEAAPILRDLTGRADVVLGSPNEVAVVAGRSADDQPSALAASVLELGPTIALLKLGADGGMAAARGGSVIERPALPVAMVVDPVGAGDAFTAGWISAQLEGADLDEALEVAVACGAAAVAAEGDMSGLPTRAELAHLRSADGIDTIR